MNERILELAKHASKLVRIEHPELSNGITMKEMSKFKVKTFLLTEYDVEKFAELIVSDAIAKIESVGFKSSNDIPFEITDLFVSQIKQHFGVEE